ncbi:hypothetical protein SBV1_1380001 [Verrucomicrobia bacterium]|nr:hypothetical protein SBV1_1380001 [Verrucomicrobiota bacterium]
MAIGDVDGDGKPDIALTSESDLLSLFKNNSTPGNISFGTRVDFATGSNPTGVVIGDLDGDGRPDIALGNIYGGTVSLYRNVLTGPPLIVSQPANQAVVLGSNATFTVVSSGTVPLSYQWFFDATNVISGATNPTLSITDVRFAQAGVYAVLVSNAYGANFSSNALLTVGTIPAITGQPQSMNAPVGGTAIFMATASGTPPLSYQWSLDGTNLAGATTNLLILTNIQSAQAGNYTVLVTNGYGSVLSSNAFLVIVPPSCVSLSNGLAAWWKGNGDGSDSAGSNSIPSLSGIGFGPGEVGLAFAFDGAAHNVIVPDSPALDFGSNQDFSIEVWVQPALANAGNSFMTIVDKRLVGGVLHDLGYALSLGNGQVQFRMSDSLFGISSAFGPAGPDLRDGSFHHLAVRVIRNSTAGGNLYVDGQAVLTFDPTAQSASLLSTQPLRIGNPSGQTFNGFFQGAIDELSLYRRALSSAEVLAIYNAGHFGKCPVPIPPFLVSQPQSLRALLGCPASFGAAAGGSQPLNYQWWKDGLSLNRRTNSTLALASITTNDFGNYTVVVTNSFGSVTSSIAMLSPEQPPVAGAVTVQRFAEGGVRISTAVLLANVAAQNGTPLAVVGVSSNSSGGGTVSLSGTWVCYLPPAGSANSDSFSYTVSDGQCGGTAVGTVTVQIKPNDPVPLNFMAQLGAGGSLSLSFDGVPGWAYRVQYKNALTDPVWLNLPSITADGYGVGRFEDVLAAPARFYRAVGP